MMDKPPDPQDGSSMDRNGHHDPLTSIRRAYTLAATPEASEVYELMVKNFLNTLAEIAIAVASRQGVER